MNSLLLMIAIAMTVRSFAASRLDRWNLGAPVVIVAAGVVNRRTWPTRDELRIAIVTWIERTYHRRRRQTGLGRLTPSNTEQS